eukprot:TRINITY_DN41074_c0_g1_i1.p1 TRINITY_DN41074_c0_g1~~TRINITY_DN41074_c0_g1_i1.p1  ORF type:complete len:465 (-),score=61.43 TRINITY_DN41074_c0_g1_i1:94-1488(-)
MALDIPATAVDEAAMPCHDWRVLASKHDELWDLAVRPSGKLTSEELQERKREGERRLPAEVVGSLLLQHAALQSWAVAESAPNCAAATEAVASWLGKQSGLRLRRSDWTVLLEVCTGAEDGLADLALPRVDFLEWPKFIVDMGRGRGCPSLGTLCARRLMREPEAWGLRLPKFKAQRELCERRGGGVGFHAARFSAHDPFPQLVPGSALRSAQFSDAWPYRLLRLKQRMRVIHQHPNKRLGTGAIVWGAAVAFCEELERRGCNYMEGKRVIELGAGTGVCALQAALLGARAVVATDLLSPGAVEEQSEAVEAFERDGGLPDDSLLRLIEKNFAANAAALPPPEQQLRRAVPLLWGNASQEARVLELCGGGCDMILCSEVAYDSSVFPLLLKTLIQLMSASRNNGSSCCVLMCHYPRAQGGNDEPEIREFERQAIAAGLAVDVRDVVGVTTGQHYVFHELRLVDS